MDADLECEECGKTFYNPAGLFTHQKKKCRPGKRSIKELLSDARDYWRAVNPKLEGAGSGSSRKRPRIGSSTNSQRSDRATTVHEESRLQPSEALGASHSTQALGDPDIAMRDLSEFEPSHRSATDLVPERNTIIDNSDPSTEPSSSSATCERNRPDSIDQGLATNLNARYTSERDKWGRFKRFLSPKKPTHDPELKTPLPNHKVKDSQCSFAPQDVSTGTGEGGSERQTLVQDHVGVSQDSFPNIANVANMPSYHPYPNWSSFALGDWYWSKGVINSKERFGELLRILSHPDFKKEDVCSTSWDRIHRILPNNITVLPTAASLDDGHHGSTLVDDTGFGWNTAEVNLEVPFPNRGQGRRVKTFKAGVLHYRSIVPVIKEKFADPEVFAQRHYQPYEHMWQPYPHREPIRIYGELYTSNEFLRVQEKVQRMTLSNPSDVGLERVVVALMIWSDATLLANFGTAKLWPCYLFFGNDSKYLRAKPSADLCNHIAYFEMLPDAFKDWYFSESKLKPDSKGQSPSQDLVTYCNRQMFHRQWDILLDDELVHAMQHGIRILCPDNITRLFFPWVFTYSADYPEKALIGTIRSLGQRPCPRCLTKKCELHQMGTQDDLRRTQPRCDDQARQELVKTVIGKIMDEGYAVGSDHVDDLLREASMLPIQNTFSKLSSLEFDVFSTLVVDLMHEFELGVWKALFIHLIRILEAHDRLEKSTTVHELDRRYRQMPAFGSDAVRTFSSNASEQKRLGARDYENLLQARYFPLCGSFMCAIPAFDRLLPDPHNSIICNLLATCAEWHALAKLRMHTEDTLLLLESTTAILARQFNLFTEITCTAYQTTETSKEYTARLRRASKAVNHGDSSNPPPQNTPLAAHPLHSAEPSAAEQLPIPVAQIAPLPTPKALPKGRLRKTFNLNTYKYHALADYASTIRTFGTTDSFSTERGELEHKFPKSWFLRTDKKTYRLQLARIERRRANLRKIAHHAQSKNSSAVPPAVQETNGLGAPALKYRIAKSQNTFKATTDYVPHADNGYDPALVGFIPDLQKHLLSRIKNGLEHHDLGDNRNSDEPADWTFVSLRGSRIYEHKTVHLGYTSYNCREEEDLVYASGSKTAVMVLNPSYPNTTGAHPFLYARVQGIFHANVLYTKEARNPNPVRMDFLWVRWFRWEGKSTSSYSLDLLSFPPVTEDDAFGFLNPSDIVRGCYVAPRFSESHLKLHESVSSTARDSEDFAAYFVNPFPDRDMYMRYQWGYAVGHAYSHLSNLQSGLTPVSFLATHLQVPSDGTPQLPSPSQSSSVPGGLHNGAEPPDASGSYTPPDAPSRETDSQDAVPCSTDAEQARSTDAIEAGEDEWVFRQHDEEPLSGDDCERDSESDED